MSVFLAILPIAVKIIGWWLDKSNASAEQKRLFFEWVKRAGQDFSSSKLLELSDAQLKWLKDNEWKETT